MKSIKALKLTRSLRPKKIEKKQILKENQSVLENRKTKNSSFGNPIASKNFMGY